jgi:hypothetical protein
LLFVLRLGLVRVGRRMARMTPLTKRLLSPLLRRRAGSLTFSRRFNVALSTIVAFCYPTVKKMPVMM